MLEFKSEYSLPTGYHEKLFDALKSYFKCAGEDYTTIDETIYMEYGGGADVDGYGLKFSPEALVSAVESGSRSLEGELVPLIDYELIGGGETYEYLPCGCQVDIPMNDSMVAASQFLRNLQNAGVDIGKLPNLSCDECSQLAAKVIPYAENRAQPAPDRTLGHKHEVNRDMAQRMHIVLICSWVLCWAPAVNWILIIAQFVMNIIVLNDLAHTFGKESAYTIGLVLLGIVFWPMLGFGESEPVDLEDDSDTDYEVL